MKAMVPKGPSMNEMLRQAQKMQEDMQAKQAELEAREYDVSAGGGAVKVKINGKREILSIDIADVDVGQNIGARLETDRAEADKKIAQAKAEERRAMATAAEQEMKAKVMEMRAKLVESEAQVPMAMSDALRSGRLGVMDYYNMKNIQADTQMRTQLVTSENSQPNQPNP